MVVKPIIERLCRWVRTQGDCQHKTWTMEPVKMKHSKEQNKNQTRCQLFSHINQEITSILLHNKWTEFRIQHFICTNALHYSSLHTINMIVLTLWSVRLYSLRGHQHWATLGLINDVPGQQKVLNILLNIRANFPVQLNLKSAPSCGRT